MIEVDGYDGKYVVYDCGCVVSYQHGKTKPIRFLKQDIYKGDYRRVTLSKNNIQTRIPVHRLVATLFIPNPHLKPWVNHKDGNSTNNHVSNLEWCTPSENERHSYDVLGKIPSCAKMVVDKNGLIHTSITKAARANGINPSTLLAILRGQIKQNHTGCQLL